MIIMAYPITVVYLELIESSKGCVSSATEVSSSSHRISIWSLASSSKL